MRIVSLIPSGTEIVWALGMGHALVARSHGCDHPSEVHGLPVVTRPRLDPGLSGGEIDAALRGILAAGEGVYEVDLERLASLRPDVILTQDCCDVCAVSLREVERAVRAVAALSGTRVCALHAHDLETLRADFRAVAEALDVREVGLRLCERFDERLERVSEAVSAAEPKRVALVEWLEPPMVAGGWIPELARIAGARPLIVDEPQRFETVSWDRVRAAEPEVIVLLPCGWGVERTRAELDRRELADVVARAVEAPTQVWIVDGDAYFNRPGPRLSDSADILARVLHPECFAGAERPPLEPSMAVRWEPIPPTLQRTISVPSSSE